MGLVVEGSSGLLHQVLASFTGIGGGVKPPKPGEPYPVPMSLSSSIRPYVPPVMWPLFTLSCSISPGFANGNGMGARAFPGVGAQPGEDTWAKAEFKEGGWGGARGSGEQKTDFYGEDRGRMCLSAAWSFLGLGRGCETSETRWSQRPCPPVPSHPCPCLQPSSPQINFSHYSFSPLAMA